MDPFSTVVGAIALAETCFKITTHLGQLMLDAKSIDSDIEQLIHEVDGVAELCKTVEKTLRPRAEAAGSGGSSPPSPVSWEPTEATGVTDTLLWKQLGNALQGCRVTVDRLDDIILKILGPPGRSSASSFGARLESISKLMRKAIQDSQLRHCRTQLATFQRTLQVVLTTMI